MDNPGDSSSESDISDPWSLIDRDSCDTDEIPGPGLNSRVGSVCGELSDGESLEVIDEEDHHEAEFQDTDGVSIITDSEINEELDQTLPAALSKEKKYLHHPNTYLNTRLNVLLALSFAAVTGLGVGHFLGLQEECPLDASLTAQLTKLQKENEFLQQKLNQILHEKKMHINHKNENWEYRSEPKFRSNGVDLRPCLELEVKDLPSQQTNEHTGSEHLTEFGYEKLTHVSPGDFFKVIQNNRGLAENGINSNFVEEQEKNSVGSRVLDAEKENAFEDTILDEYSIPTNADEEDDTEKGIKDFVENLNHLLSNDEKESGEYVGNIEDDSDKVDRMDVEGKVRNIVELKSTYKDMEKQDENVITIDSKESISDSSFMSNSEDKFMGTSGAGSDRFIYPTNNADNEDVIISEHISEVDENIQDSHIYPELLEDAVNEENSLEENNLQIIKSTLKLLKVHFDKNILSADTESVLSSAVALATEHEQSLIRLQNTVTECKVKNDNFCIQFQKRLKTSASKLEETSEQLVDDIDEQMHKLLTRIVRKLKKFKSNVQSKWCHLKNEHHDTNDWLESSVLLDCKKNYKKEHSLKSKNYEKSSEKIIKHSPKHNEKYRNHEMMIDKSYTTEAFSENNNKQSVSGNENHERVLQNNWEQDKINKKVSYGKVKNKKENNKNFSQHKKIKYEYTKSEWDNNQKKAMNNAEIKNDKRKGSMYYNHYVVLDHGKTWPTLNVASSKQNNVSGEWILKLADGRAEQRKLSHRSDWVFDRADARKIKREKYQTKDDWYFQRARGREDCRYNSYSDLCKGRDPNNLDNHNKYENNRWSKKFTRTFATAGKWVKDSFSRLQNKMNYYH